MKSFLPLLRREWRLLLFGFLMTFGSSYGQTFFIALFSGDIREELNLGHSEFGLLYSGATLLSAFLLLWTGSLIDRWDLRSASYLIVLGLGAGCYLTGLASGPVLLFFGFLLLRHTGQALMSMAGLTSVVRYIPDGRGKASAIATSGFAVAEALLPLLAVALLASWGWRQSFFAWGTVLLLVMPPLVWLLLRDHGRRHAQYLDTLRPEYRSDGTQNPAARRQWSRADMLRDPLLYLFLPALMAQPLLFTGFMFHQVQLVAEKGWTLPFWAGLYVLYALTSSAVKFVTGLMIDRFGAQPLLPFMILPLGASLLLLGLADAAWAAVGFMLLIGVSTGLYTTAASPFYAERYGTLHLGAIKSVTTALMVCASAIAPVVMGWGLDAGVTLSAMALVAAAYVALASALAEVGCRRDARIGA
ncbi:MFS transporter [Chromatocurvus halotolerans]|uniref:Putative MFS family arabinose efflux permease n=1 Tax=Chromatocurvus halotolerans TaxID=1132028 RepID=A0A4R2KZH5_9GAMM|nr:MFS transporter [Chromatocurvus halotolerans]TCO78327.1 putative MFS family arabinose efflux permease [Chromatocurvus halotolerans]